jgi:hypothetical protein
MCTGTSITLHQLRLCDEQPGLDVGIVGMAGEPVPGGQLVIRVTQALRETGLVVAMLTGKDVHAVGAFHHHRSIGHPIVKLGGGRTSNPFPDKWNPNRPAEKQVDWD